MGERCLMGASLAVLIFHPSSTIHCFKSNPNSPISKPKHDDFNKNKQNPQTKPSHSIKNASKNVKSDVTELNDGETSKGVIETIFKSRCYGSKNVEIEKILKVNHNPCDKNDVFIAKFEEYRAKVIAKAQQQKQSIGKKTERILFDGNEILRFYNTNVKCELGFNGVSSICHNENCGVCRMISTSKFSTKQRSSVFSVLSDKVLRNDDDENKRQNGTRRRGRRRRKAVVLCRVIVGRTAKYGKKINGVVEDCERGEFDSVVCVDKNGGEEIIVFNEGAVLPCFVVFYWADYGGPSVVNLSC